MRPLDLLALPALYDAFKSPSILLTGSGGLLYANPAATKLLGQPLEKLRGEFIGRYLSGLYEGLLEAEAVGKLLVKEEPLELLGTRGLVQQLNQTAPDGSPCALWMGKDS